MLNGTKHLDMNCSNCVEQKSMFSLQSRWQHFYLRILDFLKKLARVKKKSPHYLTVHLLLKNRNTEEYANLSLKIEESGKALALISWPYRIMTVECEQHTFLAWTLVEHPLDNKKPQSDQK